MTVRGQNLETWSYGYENNGISCVQCRLGRGLTPYQVASWSIQPFGHNTPTLQTGHRFTNASPKTSCRPLTGILAKSILCILRQSVVNKDLQKCLWCKTLLGPLIELPDLAHRCWIARKSCRIPDVR